MVESAFVDFYLERVALGDLFHDVQAFSHLAKACVVAVEVGCVFSAVHDEELGAPGLRHARVRHQSVAQALAALTPSLRSAHVEAAVLCVVHELTGSSDKVLSADFPRDFPRDLR